MAYDGGNGRLPGGSGVGGGAKGFCYGLDLWGEAALGECGQCDVHKSRLDAETRAMPDFATKLRREPAAMRRADVERLREQGLTDEQILSATLMACLFNFMTRMADGLGVEVAEGRQARERGGACKKSKGTQHDAPHR